MITPILNGVVVEKMRMISTLNAVVERSRMILRFKSQVLPASHSYG